MDIGACCLLLSLQALLWTVIPYQYLMGGKRKANNGRVVLLATSRCKAEKHIELDRTLFQLSPRPARPTNLQDIYRSTKNWIYTLLNIKLLILGVFSSLPIT